VLIAGCLQGDFKSLVRAEGAGNFMTSKEISAELNYVHRINPAQPLRQKSPANMAGKNTP